LRVLYYRLFVYFINVRVKKNQKIQQQLCRRFVELLEAHLGLTDAQAARALGYKNPATLWKIRRAETFVDVERLVTLARIGGGRTPNIHWLLTGEGTPLIATTGRETSQAIRLISQLNRSQQRALIALILPETARSRRT
jgi:hypothetical protein